MTSPLDVMRKTAQEEAAQKAQSLFVMLEQRITRLEKRVEELEKKAHSHSITQ